MLLSEHMLADESDSAALAAAAQGDNAPLTMH
jgi:hypothetical protein